MDFYDAVTDLYTEVSFKCPRINKDTEAKFKSFIRDIVFNNRRCLVYGDYDPDGLFSTLIVKESFHLMGYTNFDICKYHNRTHALDPEAKTNVLAGDYDYMFISDTASSNLKDIQDIVAEGIRVIIIDHHETVHDAEDFPDECVFINSTVENRTREDKLVVSAAALVFIMMYSYLKDCRIDGRKISAYALASMYADSIDMSSKFARGLYTLATHLPRELIPIEISAFLNEHKKFARRFIEFDMVPKLNSAFRSEKFHTINETLLGTARANSLECYDMVEYLADLHNDMASLVTRVSNIIYAEELEHFIIGNLDTVNGEIDVIENKLYNLTGLVANKLADKYKKSAIVICTNDSGVKGSFRDLVGRAYLPTFRSICTCGGHVSAFGFSLGIFEVQDFIRKIKVIDDNFGINERENEPIILSIPNPDISLLQDMAKYNEFAGSEYPLTLLRVPRTSAITEMKNRYGGYNYKWNGRLVVSRKPVAIGEDLLIRPTIALSLRLYTV